MIKINRKLFFENRVNEFYGMLKRSFYRQFLKTLFVIDVNIFIT